MRKPWALALLLALALAALPSPAQVGSPRPSGEGHGVPLAPAARAQEAIAVTSAEVDNRFPEGLFFRLSATSASPIQRVIFNYSLGGRSTLYGLPTFEAGTTIRAKFQLKGNDPPRVYMPPGTPITYHWELEDGAGRRLTTAPATIAYDDIRFTWQRQSLGPLTVHWYAGSAAQATRLLQVGSEAIDRVSSLTGADARELKVKVWAYASRQDMQPALQRRSEAFEREVITLGVRVSDDTVLILARGGAEDVLRHELAHIVTRVAGEGPFGSLPPWLDEGTAVYAQASAGGYSAALNDAIRRDRLLPISSLTAHAGRAEVVDLWYGQSWALVKYLIDSYGQEKFTQLFAIFKKGSTSDRALQEVYGFDLAGLEDRWRQSVGLAPAPRLPTPEPGPALPTIAPIQAPQLPPPAAPAQPAPAAQEGVALGLLVGLGALALVLAGLAGLFGLLLARRLRR